MPVDRETVITAVQFFGDMFDLAPGQETAVGLFADGWIATPHFAVKFDGSLLPAGSASAWPRRNQEEFNGWLVGIKSGQYRTPMTRKRGHVNDVWHDKRGLETCVQSAYGELLRGLKVFRYDGPGFKGAPLVGMKDGEPVAVVMPYVLNTPGDSIQ